MNSKVKMLLISSTAIVGLILPGATQSADAARTPQLVVDGYPVRYENNKASFYNKSASEGYTNVWRSARDAWNNTGKFKWTETTNENSRTFTTSVSKSDGQWADATGMTYSRTHVDATNAAWQTGSSIYLNRYNLDKYSYTTAEKVNVATHEMGHGLGLDHNPSTSSIMYYAARSQHIDTDDINGVSAIYGTSLLSSDDSLKASEENSIQNSSYNLNISYVNDYSGQEGITKMKSDSQMIVVGTVGDSESYDNFSRDDDNHYTKHTLNVSDTLKGDKNENMKFYQSGTDKVTVADSKLLQTGDRVLLMLQKDDDGEWHVMNDGDGIFTSDKSEDLSTTTEAFRRVSDGSIITQDMLK